VRRTSPNRKAPPPLGYLACRYFLRQHAPAGPWVLTAIDPDDRRQITTNTFTRLKDAREFIAEHNAAGMGVYYSINPCKTALQSKASKGDIARVEYLQVDADPRKDELPEVFKARMLAAIAAFGHYPTFIIDSGNGLQLLFRLSTAVEITDDAVIADIEARNHALAVAFGADPVTRDISRVFRLPWTWNYPNEPKRRVGREICRSHLVGYMATDHALENFPPHVPSNASAAAHGAGNAGGEGTEALPARQRTLLLVDGEGAYDTRSHLLFAFLAGAIRAGVADATIIDSLLDPQYAGKGIYQHIAENGGRDCAERQLQHAHDKVGLGRRQHGIDDEARPLVRRRIDQFARRDIEWLWYPFIPLGMITLLCGDKAMGKSSVALDAAARISTGRNWPRFGTDEEVAAPLGSVIILCKENDISRIIRPRLEAAGADLSRIHTLGYEVPDDPEQIDPLERIDTTVKQLEQHVREIGDVRLIDIDPITDYVGKIDMMRDNQVRALLNPWGRLASRYDLAMLNIIHLNKKVDLPMAHRTLGSGAFRNVSQSTLLVAKDDDGLEHHRIMARETANLCAETRAVRFSTVAVGAYHRVDWSRDWENVDVDELMTDNKRKTKKDKAVQLLRQWLADGPVLVTTLEARAKAAHIGWRTMQDAKKESGAVSDKPEGTRFDEWRWKLPG
jgi:hypothetical protein